MTLVARPAVPETMCGAVQANTDPQQTCRCTDPDLIRLRGLIAKGMDQFDASKLIWGDQAHLPTRRTSLPVIRGLFGIGLRGRR